jgi:hypothetical protein
MWWMVLGAAAVVVAAIVVARRRGSASGGSGDARAAGEGEHMTGVRMSRHSEGGMGGTGGF